MNRIIMAMPHWCIGEVDICLADVGVLVSLAAIMIFAMWQLHSEVKNRRNQ